MPDASGRVDTIGEGLMAGERNVNSVLQRPEDGQFDRRRRAAIYFFMAMKKKDLTDVLTVPTNQNGL